MGEKSRYEVACPYTSEREYLTYMAFDQLFRCAWSICRWCRLEFETRFSAFLVTSDGSISSIRGIISAKDVSKNPAPAEEAAVALVYTDFACFFEEECDSKRREQEEDGTYQVRESIRPFSHPIDSVFPTQIRTRTEQGRVAPDWIRKKSTCSSQHLIWDFRATTAIIPSIGPRMTPILKVMGSNKNALL
jgi:hypothetical protein